MIKNKVYADAFRKLGKEELDDETLATIEAFTCAIFGYTNLDHITDTHIAKPNVNQKQT